MRQNLLYIPALIIMATFIIYPLFKGFSYSFYRWNGYSQKMTFIGVQNYLNMLKDSLFKASFVNTLFYAVVTTALQEVLGVLLAIFLNTKFRGRVALRTIVYLPVVISAILMGYIMTFFFQYNYGALNDIIGWFGLEPIDWLRDPARGRTIVSIVTAWHYTGSTMIIFLAGLQDVPQMYLEAAKLDGANEFQLFWHIKLPLLQPAFASTTLLNLIGGLKLYDSIVSLTNGGPVQKTNSLSTLISYEYFTAEKAGYAAAIGVFQFVFIFVISSLLNRYLQKKEVRQ